MRPDLVIRSATFQEETSWLVKNPISLEYHRLHPAQFAVLKLCDGNRSATQILDELSRQFPFLRFSPRDLQSLIADFQNQGLVTLDRPGRSSSLIARRDRLRFERLRDALRNLLFLRLPGWNADFVLKSVEPVLGWLFTLPGAIISISTIVASWVLLAVRIEPFTRDFAQLQQQFGWSQFVWLWITLGLAKVVHELGHGVCCRKMGGECHEIGLALMIFSPSLYCDVSDAWMLPQKRRRIAIGLAGMYVELLIAAGSLIVWTLTSPGIVHYFALHTYCVTTLTTILFNANPLLQYDGYYLASDWLEVPNLRARSERMLRRVCSRLFLGIDTAADPFLSAKGGNWLALYALASTAYRWVMLISLAWVLRSALAPWGLSDVGTIWGAFTALWGCLMLLHQTVQLVRQHREHSMKPFRLAVTCLASALLAAAAFSFPFSLRSEIPVTCAPVSARAVFAQVAGELQVVHVQPGAWVEEGETLLEFVNFDRADQLMKLEASREIQEIELDLQIKLNNAAGVRLTTDLLDRMDEQINELKADQTRLIVVAPVSGWVVSAVGKPDGKQVLANDRPGWSGDPLAVRNVGAWIEPGTHLLTIAPNNAIEVRGVVEQSQRNDIEPGDSLVLKFESVPEASIVAEIESIADRHIETVELSLSNKFGGPLATRTDQRGQETLNQAAFSAQISVSASDLPVVSGSRGAARFLSQPRTAVQWIWRWIRRNLE